MAKVINSIEKSKYTWKSTRRNPDKLPSVAVPSFDTCHINNKLNQNLRNFCTGAPVYDRIFGFVQVNEKWITQLTDGETIIETNDLKQSRHRKLKTIKKFCDHFEPLYQARKVSLLFFTFTRANYARLDMITMLKRMKKRLWALKWPLRGYLWVMETKENGKMIGGYHVHYHLIVATDRVKIKKIPDQLRLGSLWGQRTQVEFVRKSIRSYLGKYINKSDCKMLTRRNYAISKKLL